MIAWESEEQNTDRRAQQGDSSDEVHRTEECLTILRLCLDHRIFKGIRVPIVLTSVARVRFGGNKKCAAIS